MGTFKQLIDALHEGSGLKDSTPLLRINEYRQIILANTNSIIAYEGDVNSQIIVFDCPKIVEGHNLQNCQFKRIKWSNTSSGFEGKSTLHPVSTDIDETTNRMLLQWEVEPEVFVKAGNIQITISFYDLDEQGRVAFQWNTASFSGLSVGATDVNVGFFEPAENEVLTINEETKTIIAPLGYNNIIGNYGDIGVSTVYFRTKRKIRGIDLLGDGKVVLRINLNGKIYVEKTENLEIKPYSAQVDDYEGLVYITWSVPKEITNNDQLYSGSFSIEIGFETQDQSKVWRTSTYNQLTIGNSMFKSGQENNENPDVQYIIDGNKEGGIDTTVPGTYLLKKLNADNITLRDGELGVSYDKDGNYTGLKLGLSSENSEIKTLPVELNTVKYSKQELTDKEKQQAIINIGASSVGHKHTKSEITDFPTSMTPTAHNHSVNDVTGAAKLQSPNDMLHNGNEFTFIPAGHSGEIYINHRTASGATDGNISNYHFCDGKGGEATIIANYFKGKFQGKDARPIYNNEEVAMLSDVPSKTEKWTFTLEDNTKVEKVVYVG